MCLQEYVIKSSEPTYYRKPLRIQKNQIFIRMAYNKMYNCANEVHTLLVRIVISAEKNGMLPCRKS
jgi:hypothetical protein